MPNETVKVTYKLVGLAVNNQIPNQAKITYDYLDSDNYLISTYKDSNTIYTDVVNEEKEKSVKNRE